MSIFSFIKEHISILEIIGQYTTLKRAGTYWKGACPFHNEKTGSFTVSPHREMFYCFGCHIGGDSINFVSKAENCTPVEAAKFLAERYSLELPQALLREIPQQLSTKERYMDTCKAAAGWMYQQLKKNESAATYATKRNITSQTIDKYLLGFMPGGPKGIRLFINAMSASSILLEDLINAGLVIQGKNNIYSPYEDRIVFPIKDTMGRFCGFGGRVYKPEDARPKYYNSKEHECFAKNTLLYGLADAKKTIQEQGIAFMVEGYMDCIMMAQHGYLNTVATMGTACTIGHLKLIARYANELYVLYDADSAGQHAIIKLTELCWQVALTLKIVTLPRGQDPDSFLRTNNSLKPLIMNAQDIFVFFIESMGKEFHQKTVHEKVTLSKQLLTIIKTVQDPFTKDLLLQQAAKTFDIPFESLRHELKRTQAPLVTDFSPSSSPTTATVQTEDQYPIESLEKKIFCAILSKVSLLREHHYTMVVHHIPEPYKLILEQLLDQYKKDPALDFSHFFARLTTQEQTVVSRIMLEEQTQNLDETFDQLVLQLHRKQWKTFVKETTREIHHAKIQGDEKRVQELLHNFLTLKQTMLPSHGKKGDL